MLTLRLCFLENDRTSYTGALRPEKSFHLYATKMFLCCCRTLWWQEKKKVMNWKENDDFRKMRGNKICIVWVDLGRKAKFVHSNKREAKDMDTSAHGCWCSARSFVGHLLFAAVLPMKLGVMSSRKSIREMVRNLWGEEKRCELIEKEWGRIGKHYRNIP